MSDNIQHECGLAYIRLLQPLSYYYEKYGTSLYGLNKLFLLMEKQHNRGQDGAGVASVKLGTSSDNENMHRLRISGQHAIGKIMQSINDETVELNKRYPGILKEPARLKGHHKFVSEVLLGHLRYGTQGKNNIEFCHPFIKYNIKPALKLAIAGNFNLVNTDELYNMLHQRPESDLIDSDLGAMIETIYHAMVEEESRTGTLDIANVLKKTTSLFDGGFVFSGLTGGGDSFVMRDANGIRPCYYYSDDEVVVAASERAAIMTAFNVRSEQVKHLQPGHALIVAANGNWREEQILEPRELKACSFERIYFSRGSDAAIYKERKQLGWNLAKPVLKMLDYHLKHTIVSFIPNTAETAFYGLIKGLEDYLKEVTLKKILEKRDSMTEQEMRDLIARRVRIEKIAIKDAKLRTFITDDSSRNEMVQHVYDITYDTVERGVDTLVIIDDSIVRGTTLRESIIKMLDRLGPKRIIIVSSAPQVRYPDCYGIDMSKMGDFIAFEATVGLWEDNGKAAQLHAIYDKCKVAEADGTLDEVNFVKEVYDPFTPEEVSEKIARMLKPAEVQAAVDVIYQSLDGLHDACPRNTGDWYFTGDYPTRGGNRVANKAFINYVERKQGRGY